MSESDNPSPPKPPTIKTSAVPLKKETVRITLRPSAPASEPLPAVPPPPPTARSATPPTAAVPRPTGSTPVPTVNLGSAPPPPAVPRPTGPAPTGAPTIPLRSAPPTVRPVGGGAPPPPGRAGGPPPAPAATGSKTIPLAAPPAAARPLAPPSRPTSSAPGGSPATQPLPKATVKLQKPAGPPTGPPTSVVSSAPSRASLVDDDDEEEDEGPLNMVAALAIVFAIAAMLVAAMSWEHFWGRPFVKPSEGDAVKQEWLAAPSPEDATKLQEDYNPFHNPSTQDTEGAYRNNFETILNDRVAIPQLVES